MRAGSWLRLGAELQDLLGYPIMLWTTEGPGGLSWQMWPVLPWPGVEAGNGPWHCSMLENPAGQQERGPQRALRPPEAWERPWKAGRVGIRPGTRRVSIYTYHASLSSSHRLTAGDEASQILSCTHSRSPFLPKGGSL